MTQECGRRVTPWQSLPSWFRSRPTPPQLCLYGSTWPHSSREFRDHPVQVTAYLATHSHSCPKLPGLTYQVRATGPWSRLTPPQPVCLELRDLNHQDSLETTWPWSLSTPQQSCVYKSTWPHLFRESRDHWALVIAHSAYSHGCLYGATLFKNHQALVTAYPAATWHNS